MSGLEIFMQTAKGRRSVRRYLDAPVDDGLIGRLVEAASWAPSPQNRQGWKFTVVKDRDKIRNLAASVRERWDALAGSLGGSAVSAEIAAYSPNFSWFDNAPVIIVVSARRPETFMRELFGDEAGAVSGSSAAAAMAAQNLMLAAHSAGLGSCCITGVLAANDAINNMTGLGGRWGNVCIISLGYPDESPEPPPRKGFDEVTALI